MDHFQTDSVRDWSDPIGMSRTNNRIEGSAVLGFIWLHDLIERATGLDLDEQQVIEVTRLANRKLVDLFDIAEETAAANGRTLVLRHDLPLTKGLRRSIEDAALLTNGIDAEAILTFLASSGMRAHVDEGVQADIPRLTAALLILSSRVITLLEPGSLSPLERLKLLDRTSDGRPTTWEIDRAKRVIDLTL
jgi:hypothetical protein